MLYLPSFIYLLIHDLTSQLCDLYENDSIFDKFECCLSGDGLRVATGSYRYECMFDAVFCSISVSDFLP